MEEAVSEENTSATRSNKHSQREFRRNPNIIAVKVTRRNQLEFWMVRVSCLLIRSVKRSARKKKCILDFISYGNESFQDEELVFVMGTPLVVQFNIGSVMRLLRESLEKLIRYPRIFFLLLILACSHGCCSTSVALWEWWLLADA